MSRRTITTWLGLGVLALSCSGRSIVIGGDPNGAAGESYSGATATGGDGIGGNGGTAPGSVTGGTGVAATGASMASGGSSVLTGIPSTGGAYGGTSTGVNGGTSVLGGTSGAGTAEGGEGSVVDPYARVFYEDGQGYRVACPKWGDTWGFTCWNTSNGTINSCGLDGSPYCNSCSCAVPCETSTDCPSALTGQPAACLSSSTNVPSCFVLCESVTHCPTGMTCSMHPGSGRQVCVWVSDRVD